MARMIFRVEQQSRSRMTEYAWFSLATMAQPIVYAKDNSYDAIMAPIYKSLDHRHEGTGQSVSICGILRQPLRIILRVNLTFKRDFQLNDLSIGTLARWLQVQWQIHSAISPLHGINLLTMRRHHAGGLGCMVCTSLDLDFQMHVIVDKKQTTACLCPDPPCMCMTSLRLS